MKTVSVSYSVLWTFLNKIGVATVLFFHKNHIQFYIGDYITPT